MLKNITIKDKIELALVLIALTGLILRMCRMGEGNDAVFIGGMLLLLLYILYSLLSLGKWKISKGAAILNLLFFYYAAIAAMMILYGMMYWPVPISIGQSNGVLEFSVIVTIIYFLIRGRKKPEQFIGLMRSNFIRAAIFLVLSNVLYMIPLENRIDLFASHPEAVRDNLRQQK